MHMRADMRSGKDQLFIINSDSRRVCRTRESHQAGRGPRSAGLIKISAISRMDVPSDPESRAQSSPTGGAAGPPFPTSLFLSFSLSSGPRSLAVLCFAEDRIC